MNIQVDTTRVWDSSSPRNLGTMNQCNDVCTLNFATLHNPEFRHIYFPDLLQVFALSNDIDLKRISDVSQPEAYAELVR